MKDEGRSVDKLLESLCCQTRQPDEVIVVDGGSSDDTMDQLRAWEERRQLPLRVLIEPGCNIARGRNIAIAAAGGSIIASTDAGVRLEPQWLAELTQAFEHQESEEPAPVVACGFFVPDATTVFETAMGATVLPALEDVNPKTFLPSSRSVAFLRSDWEAVRGYPDWLDYCEDLILDFRLRAIGRRFVFVPNAVAHFRPRSSLRAFLKQYYLYARGDGKAGLWPKRHAARYLTYLVILPVLLWLTFVRNPLWAVLLLVGAAIMLGTPYKRLFRAMRSLDIQGRLKAIAWVPIIRVTGDIAKMIGYPAGLLWRLRHRHQVPDWRERLPKSAI